MKIVYISTSEIPSRTANSIHVMKMCSAFSSLGHEVILVVPAIKGSNQECPFTYYGTSKNFKIKKLFWGKFRGVAYIFSVIAALYSSKLKPDLVISREITASYFSSRIKVKTIGEIHAPVHDMGIINKFFFNKAVKNEYFSHLILITQSLKKYYLENYPQTSKKIIVFPDSADPIDTGLMPYDIKTRSGLNIGYVGHLYKGKGMEVIYQVACNSPNDFFHIVGGLENDIDYWTKKCSDLDNIIFHGYVPQSHTSKFLLSFDVLLLPNQREVSQHGANADIGKWTSPLKAFEYMSVGKPILVSNIPVLKEIFIDNFNCILCNPENHNSWIHAIDRLRKSKHLRERLSNNSKNEFLKEYTWKKRAENILKVSGF